MSLASTYYKVRRKALGDIHGDGKAPWYTRWFWWLLIIGVGALVFTLWYFAKKREAGMRTRAHTARNEAQRAKLRAMRERDRREAARLHAESDAALARAEAVEADIEKTKTKRRKLEAAIQGAETLEELDAIEKSLP